MRAYVAMVVAALALAGCGSNGGGATRAAKCADRMLLVVKPGYSTAEKAQIRRYAMVTYCDRFARRNWVYDDGALSIEAQRWLVRSGKCNTAGPAGAPKAVPCPLAGPIDCGMLHFVRRNDVQTYLAELRRKRGTIRCDDGTPLRNLGVP